MPRKPHWPDDAPVLAEEHLAWRGESNDGARKALEWWLYRTFEEPSVFNPAADEFRTALFAVVTERFGKAVTVLNTFLAFAEQHRRPSLAWQAACWNEALSRCGYEVPDDARSDPGSSPSEE